MKTYNFKINGKEYTVAIGAAEGKMLNVNVNGADYQVELENAPASIEPPPRILRPMLRRGIPRLPLKNPLVLARRSILPCRA